MSKKPIQVQAFEVKFALDAKRVLGAEGTPTPAVADALGVKDGSEDFQIAFLDGPHVDFHTERWNIRFRDKGGKREVSFKRRLPVYHDSVQGVLETALRQGFDEEEQAEGYDAEIEWGPARRTLTLVKEKKLGAGPLPVDGRAAAVEAADSMPGKLRRWIREGWAESVLAVGRLYGPVSARRWKFTALGGKTAFEVWYLRSADGDGAEPIVEVSFKAPSESEAATNREVLRSKLLAHPGWLLKDDMLKTDLLLDRYR